MSETAWGKWIANASADTLSVRRHGCDRAGMTKMGLDLSQLWVFY